MEDQMQTIASLFSVSYGESLRTTDAYLVYHAKCIENAVNPCNQAIFGKALFEALPTTKKKKRRISGSLEKYETVYENLKVKDTCSQDKIQPDPVSFIDFPTLSTICMEAISVMKDGWHLEFSCDQFFEIAKYEGKCIDGSKIYRTVKVNKDLTWEATYAGEQSGTAEFLGTSPTVSSFSEMIRIVTVVENAKICCGVQYPEYDTLSSEVKNKGEVIGNKVKEFTINAQGDEVTSEIYRSATCSFFLSSDLGFKKRCSYCSELRRNLSVKVSRSNNTPSPSDRKVKVNKKYLSESDRMEKEKNEKRRRVNAERREKYWKLKAKEENNMRKMVQQDNDDLAAMFEAVDKGTGSNGEELMFPDNENMSLFWSMQREVISKSTQKTSIRWHPLVIKTCLALWHHSKASYELLKESGFVELPSKRLLQYYKGKIKQTPGRNIDMLRYIRKLACDQSLPPVGYCGFITFDEMAVQDDLQLRRVGESFELVGVVNLGEIYNDIQLLQTGKDETKVATHLLQFMFVGSTGFRVPVAYYPTVEVDPTSLYHKFWDTVFDLGEFGFKVVMAICDGAQANRTFIQMHFDVEDPCQSQFTTSNIYTGEPMIFVVDPSHNFKKLRNNLMKSTDNGKSPRHFKVDGKSILWSHLQQAYTYDVEHNPIQTFKYLTPHHFDPSSAEKMRNYLADDVIGKRMLEVIQNYKNHLNSNGHGGEHLDMTMEFLKTTSILLKNFKSTRSYRSSDDVRFVENQACLDWFMRWKDQVKSLEGVTQKEKNRMFLSEKTEFDVLSMIIGFKKYCCTILQMFPGSSISSQTTNQDKLENFFGQQRALNGQADNPTIMQTEHATTGIMQMQDYRGSRTNCMTRKRPFCG